MSCVSTIWPDAEPWQCTAFARISGTQQPRPDTNLTWPRDCSQAGSPARSRRRHCGTCRSCTARRLPQPTAPQPPAPSGRARPAPPAALSPRPACPAACRMVAALRRSSRVPAAGACAAGRQAAGRRAGRRRPAHPQHSPQARTPQEAQLSWSLCRARRRQASSSLGAASAAPQPQPTGALGRVPVLQPLWSTLPPQLGRTWRRRCALRRCCSRRGRRVSLRWRSACCLQQQPLVRILCGALRGPVSTAVESST